MESRGGWLSESPQESHLPAWWGRSLCGHTATFCPNGHSQLLTLEWRPVGIRQGQSPQVIAPAGPQEMGGPRGKGLAGRGRQRSGLRGPLARGAGLRGRPWPPGGAPSPARGARRGPPPLASPSETGKGRIPSHLAAKRSQILRHLGHAGVEPEGLRHWGTPRGTDVDATVFLTVALCCPALSPFRVLPAHFVFRRLRAPGGHGHQAPECPM